ncbi:MAG: citrate/2-methylcitrate synthase [Thermoprotei archaeon]
MSEVIKAPKGLYGVVVAETAIAKSGADGSLIYRGYDIQELVEHSSFEECAYLILFGRLPKKDELHEFAEKLRRERTVPESVYPALAKLKKQGSEMDLLRTAVSYLGCLESTRPHADQKISLIAKMPTLVVNCHRIHVGETPIHPNTDSGIASSMLEMITGKKPNPLEVSAFERMLIFYMEHDLNASTFTVTVVASTLADPYSAATAGICALKGPLHGGANEQAIKMLLEIGSKENARPYIESILSKGEKVFGFGHRVYKKVDPRAQLSKRILEQMAASSSPARKLYETAVEVEQLMWEKKKLPANLDFYAAPVFHVLGIPVAMYTPIFASSRIVGWMAHYDEQVSDNKIIRPDAEYVGPYHLKYVPFEQR